MLSSFYVQNFRSILELKLDFTYGEGKAPNGYRNLEIPPFIQASPEKRLVPVTAFFGANASGKSNIIKAFGALWQLLCQENPLASIFEPNLLNPKFSECTLVVEIVLEQELYEYRIVFNGTEILSESLLKNGKPLYRIAQMNAEFFFEIISTTYSSNKLLDILEVECSDGARHQTKPFLRRIALGYSGLNEDLRDVFSFFQTRWQIYLNQNAIILPLAVDLLASTISGEKTAALNLITDFVRQLDIDIWGMEMSQQELSANAALPVGFARIDPQTGMKHALQISTTHKDVDGNLKTLDFVKHQSSGTQRLAGLVGYVLFVLRTSGVFFVDELECSLHPLLMREIVMLFKKRRTNPKGAQLIFTTHNTDVLDDSILRLSEIALVRKTVANGTLVRRLVDSTDNDQDIRNVTNFRKQYLAGFYSGIPHPAL